MKNFKVILATFVLLSTSTATFAGDQDGEPHKASHESNTKKRKLDKKRKTHNKANDASKHKEARKTHNEKAK